MDHHHHLGMEDLSLIDVAAEDDNLIPSETEQFFCSSILAERPMSIEDIQARMEGEQAETSMNCNNDDFSPPRSGRTKSDRNSLRKSLAWDKAFFTNEGVLDSEELATMNKTFKEKENVLPSIKEESGSSTQSPKSGICGSVLEQQDRKITASRQKTGQGENSIKPNGSIAGRKNIPSEANRVAGRKNIPEQNRSAIRSSLKEGSGIPGRKSMLPECSKQVERKNIDSIGHKRNASFSVNNTPGQSKEVSTIQGHRRQASMFVNNKGKPSNVSDGIQGHKRQASLPAGNKLGRLDRSEKTCPKMEKAPTKKSNLAPLERQNIARKYGDTYTKEGNMPPIGRQSSIRGSRDSYTEEAIRISGDLNRKEAIRNSNPASVPGSLAKKLSSVSKRVKDTLGKVLPVAGNVTKTPAQKRQSPTAHDGSHIGKKHQIANQLSPLQSSSARLERCYSFTTFERLGSSASKIKLPSLSHSNDSPIALSANGEGFGYYTDDSSSVFQSSMSPRSSFDGLSSVSSPTHSMCSMVSPLKADAALPADMQSLEHVAQRYRVENLVTKSNSELQRPIGQDLKMPVSSPKNTNTTNIQSRSYAAKPSGLRMPSPKLGFFDTARKASNATEKIPAYSFGYKGTAGKPPRLSPGSQTDLLYSTRPTDAGKHSSLRPPSVIPSSCKAQGPSLNHSNQASSQSPLQRGLNVFKMQSHQQKSENCNGEASAHTEIDSSPVDKCQLKQENTPCVSEASHPSCGNRMKDISVSNLGDEVMIDVEKLENDFAAKLFISCSDSCLRTDSENSDRMPIYEDISPDQQPCPSPQECVSPSTRRTPLSHNCTLQTQNNSLDNCTKMSKGSMLSFGKNASKRLKSSSVGRENRSPDERLDASNSGRRRKSSISCEVKGKDTIMSKSLSNGSVEFLSRVLHNSI